MKNDPPARGASVSPASALAQASEHHKNGRLREAEALYRRGLAEQPRHARALGMLGYLLYQTGRHAEALSTLDEAVSLDAKVADTHAWRGLSLERLGRTEEAAKAYKTAVQVDPRHMGAHNNLGVVLLSLRRAAEALPYLQRAVELGYKRPEPHTLMGQALVRLGRFSDAERAYREALKLDPRFIDALVGLGNVLHDRGDLDAGIAQERLAIQANPRAFGARSNLLMKLLYHGGVSPEALAKEHKEGGQAYMAAFAGSGDPAWQIRDRDPDRRLRIGYLSPDFHVHATAFFLDPLLASHDPAVVEIHCYSGAAESDSMTAYLRGLAHGFRDVAGMPHKDLAALIAKDQIDILVDCAGHTNQNRIAVLAMKPAPLQVTWLGYPHGTGLPTVDYRLTDEIADPPGMTEPHYLEQLLRLPGGTFCYRAPDMAPPVAPGPLERGGGPVFGCFNNPHKIGPEVIRLWARIVHAVPGARLRLKAKQFLDAQVAKVFQGRFVAAGLASDRIEIEGRRTLQEGFAEYSTIDVALDPFPYHGTTSTCEALWMGAPVVTLPGATCVSRVGPSLLARVGLEDLVARDADHYVEIATRLIGDPGRLAELRRTLRGTMSASALCDGPRFARHVEDAYRDIWRRHCLSTSR